MQISEELAKQIFFQSDRPRKDALIADEVDIAARGSRAAWFLDFSNHGHSDRALQNLLGRYRLSDSVVVEASGQRLVARHLVRAEVPVLP